MDNEGTHGRYDGVSPLLLRYLDERFDQLQKQVSRLSDRVEDLQGSHDRAVGRGRVWGAFADWIKFVVAGALGAFLMRVLGGHQ